MEGINYEVKSSLKEQVKDFGAIFDVTCFVGKFATIKK